MPDTQLVTVKIVDGNPEAVSLITEPEAGGEKETVDPDEDKKDKWPMYWVGCICCYGAREWDCGVPREHVEKKLRFCTDLPWLIFFSVMFWGVLGIFIDCEVNGGDAALITKGWGLDGESCANTKTMWPDLRYPDVTVCVDSCEKTADPWSSITPVSQKAEGPGYPSETWFNQWCIPKEGQYWDAGMSDLGSNRQAVLLTIADLYTSKWFLFYTFLASIFFCGIFILMMKMCPGMMLIMLVFMLFVGGMTTGSGLIYMATIDEITEAQRNFYIIFASVAIFFTISLTFFACCCMGGAIKTAVAILQETASALRQLWLLLPLALCPTLSWVLFAFWSIFVMTDIVSMDNTATQKDLPDKPYDGLDYTGVMFDNWTLQKAYINKNPPKKFSTDLEFDYSTEQAWKITWIIVTMLWSFGFLCYFWFEVVAGAYADWYFSEPDKSKQSREVHKKIVGEEDKYLSKWPIWDSFYRTVRYHMGSCALAGSILMAIRCIRWWFEMMASGLQGENCCVRCMYACVGVCLKCIDRALGCMSKNALVIQALHGEPFCMSGYTGFKMVFDNFGDFAVLAVVVENVCNFAILGITFGSVSLVAGLGYATGDFSENQLSQKTMIFVIMTLIAMLEAWVVLTVIDAGVATIYMCYLIDRRNDGVSWAPPGIQRIIDEREKMRKAAIVKHEAGTLQKKA